MSNKKYVERSVFQSLYKYLPHAYADIDINGTTTSVKIHKWYGKLMTDISKERVAREINMKIDSIDVFLWKNDIPKNEKGNIFTETNFQINQLSGVDYDNENDQIEIFGNISPTVYFCNKCRTVHFFRTDEYSKENLKNYKFAFFRQKKQNEVCHNCNEGILKQYRLITICSCGSDYDYQPYCQKHHNDENLVYKVDKNDNFKFTCSLCMSTIKPTRKCSKCGEQFKPTSPLDNMVLIPQKVDIILFDESNKNEEELLYNTKYDFYKYIYIAKYLNIIDEHEFNKIREKIIIQFITIYNDLDESLRHRNKVRKVLNMLGINLSKFDACCDFELDVYNIKEILSILIDKKVYNLNQLLENNMANNSTIVPSKYINETREYIEHLLIEDITFSEDIPIATIAYGYTRRNPDPDPLTSLNLYENKDKNQFDMYGHKLKTEGMIITMSIKKILLWMNTNIKVNGQSCFSGFAEFSNFKTDKDYLEFYLSNYDEYFVDVKEDEHISLGIFVFTLLHSISHLIMLSISKVSGLEITNFSEKIYSKTGHIFIYCSSNQGVVLNSIKTLLNYNISDLLINAKEIADNCLLKTHCDQQEVQACLGCLIVPELTCNYFNKYLNRKYLNYNYNEEKYFLSKGMWKYG